MKTRFILISLLTLAAIGFADSTSAGLPEAVDYLKSQASDAWITQALIAAGETSVPTDHLKSVAAGGFNPTNDYAKAILALAAAGENPTTFGEIDYVAKLKTYYDGVQMGDATLLNDDVWSILAFAAIKKADSEEAVAAKNFLLANQNADGGWGYLVGGSSGSNDTAAAIMALMETGMSANNEAITKAAAFLHTMQNDDGGFMNDPAWGTDSDSGSDAWVISAIYKIDQEPTDSDWIKNGNNPLVHMQLLQDSADGGFWWVDPASSPAFNNKAMTAYAVIALAGKSFPVGYYEIPQPTPPPAPEPAPAPAPSPSSGGSVILITTYCQNVEYDIWQDICADNWQYRNVLTVTPINCTLTVEQENQRQRTCLVPEPEAKEEIPLITDEENNEEMELEPKVLSMENVDLAEQPDRVVIEAGEIISGQTVDFVAAGTNSTVKLGAGERAGVLNSYKSVFDKSPETQAEWEDVIRISNNQLPLVTNSTAEEKAQSEFKKVYGRTANMGNLNDQAAINMMAYGLRPDRRDLDLERAGIRVFVRIYKYLPVSALDWDTIRAIAYSGVGF